MTIKEALAKGIKKVRLPQWDNGAYLELPILEGGKYGPWAKLYDQSVSFGITKPMSIFILHLTKDEATDWEEY